jgi:hypothetical protein
MTYDKTHPEDIDPACEEHAVKALMYGLTRKPHWCKLAPVKFKFWKATMIAFLTNSFLSAINRWIEQRQQRCGTGNAGSAAQRQNRLYKIAKPCARSAWKSGVSPWWQDNTAPWLQRLWWRLREFYHFGAYQQLKPCRFSILVALIACFVFLRVAQGTEILRVFGEGLAIDGLLMTHAISL